MSEISQQSNESMSQYDQLENVYAPSATPCYDTPGYNNDSQPPDASKMCYLDVSIENDKTKLESQDATDKIAESCTESMSRKRNLDTAADDPCPVDAKRSKKVEEAVESKPVTANEKLTPPETVSNNSECRLEKEEKGDDELNIRPSVDASVSNSKDCTEDKQDSRIADREKDNGSRSRCEEEQTETQRGELTSDNT